MFYFNALFYIGAQLIRALQVVLVIKNLSANVG